MNDFSLLLWLGDVSGSLSGFFVFLAVVGAIATLAMFILGNLCMYEDTSGMNDERDFVLGRRLYNMSIRVTLPLFVASGILACLLPSKETVYLIAASEAGQEVLTSATGQKAVAAVNRYLDSVGHGQSDDEKDDKDNK